MQRYRQMKSPCGTRAASAALQQRAASAGQPWCRESGWGFGGQVELMLGVGQSDTLASGHSRPRSVLLRSSRRTMGCRGAMVVEG